MRQRLLAVLLACVLAGIAGSSSAQVTTGEIYGKVTDSSGALLPGVTVTLSSPVLLQPLTAVTSETGTYRFPQLSIGVYSIRFQLEGFKTVVNEGIRIEIGLNAQFNQTMAISSLEETVQVRAESPLVDLKDAGRSTRFTQEQLQAIPSSRDPWTIIEQSAGVMMDRANVGGSQSGQQSNFVARGAAFTEQKWNLDGIDITDMAATGGSPVYYDFDAFEEMQISTGGADVTMQSPGVAINLVTKSGTDKLRATGRFYVTDDAFQANNVTDEIRRQGATSGNPIQNIKDFGLEGGGPIMRGKAWFWGAYGTQNVKVGVNNFYLPTAACAAMRAAPLDYSIEDVRECLASDATELNNYNAKLAWQITQKNQFSFYFNGAEKVRNARDASDLRPIETTWRQMGVTRKDLGSNWWKTGMPKTYKWSDRHIFNDRFMAEVQYAHVGNNFTLTFHDEALRDVQPGYEISSPAGLWSRSYYEDVYVRPTDSVDLTGNYFLPGTWGGDHALKFGFKFRDDTAIRETMYGGDAYARFRLGVASEAQLYRRQATDSQLRNRSFYVQDTFTRGKITLNAGFRFDHQSDKANATSVAASPFYGQRTFAGVHNGVTYSGQPFNQLPALEFPGFDPKVPFKNFSPRAGLSYNITDDGRNVLKVNYAHYVGQLGGNSGMMSPIYNTVVLTYVRYPWVDLNGDAFIQANEIVMTPVPLAWTSGYDYTNPTRTTTSGTVDPDISNEYSNEILVTFDKQIGNDFAVSTSYIWRRYDNFRWYQSDNWSTANYTPVNYQTTCPASARCEPVTYYVPTSPIPVAYTFTNRPDFWRAYNGLELAARKRLTHGWMMNASFTYNDAPVHYDSEAAYGYGRPEQYAPQSGDPTNAENWNGGQFAPQSTTSGIDNVYVNARWMYSLSGSYVLPWGGVNLAGAYRAKQGYPFVANIQTPSRPNGAGIANVYLDKLGDERLPNFQTVDFRIDRKFTFGQLKMVPAMDIFNLFNTNTTLAKRAVQNASNGNNISAILAPRVIRFGVRVEW